VLVEGGLYAASTDDKSYFVFKVLRRGEGPALVRIYSNHFTGVPSALDESWLYVADLRRQPGAPGSLCLAATTEFLRAWKPVFIQHSTMTACRARAWQIGVNAAA
jgi:hypothetical protein